MGDIKQIFMSHCVASMGVQAMTLNEKLRGLSYSTFICTAMEGGQEFRRQITVNAANCKVMIVLMDERWAKSKECISEFNCAYSCFNKSESPQIIPIVVDGFHWIDPMKYPEAHCITANFQCLQKGKKQDWEDVFENVKAKVNAIMSEVGGVSASAAANPENTAFLEFVTCEICQEVFKDPKMLPCSHSFCRNCLLDWKKTNGGGTFPCPKCRIPCTEEIDNLQTDFRANQLIDALNNQELVFKTKIATLGSVPEGKPVVEPDWDVEPQLSDWLTVNKIPKEVIDVLIENGYEFLDIVLEMTDSDLKELGLKPGHERKLSKCIKHSNSLAETSYAGKPLARPSSSSQRKTSASNPGSSEKPRTPDVLDNWNLIEELYDDRVLSSGTIPADNLKFWASLSKLRFDNIIDTITRQAEAVATHPKMAKGIKAKCLQQAAMVLCDAGSYAHATEFAQKALEFEKSPEREYELKALLIYSMHNKLKQPMWVSETKDPKVYEKLMGLCDDVISNQNHVGKAKLCKVYILKCFTMQALINRSSNRASTLPQAQEAIKAAYAICEDIKDDGLKAEAKMTEGLLVGSREKTRSPESLRLLLQARKLCAVVYGEFSTLMARIYYNIAIYFEVNKQKDSAYECFRRTWLIDRQIAGPNHPITKKSGSVLTDDYREEAQTLKDPLPDSEDEPNERDRNFLERVKFLDGLKQ